MLDLSSNLTNNKETAEKVNNLMINYNKSKFVVNDNNISFDKSESKKYIDDDVLKMKIYYLKNFNIPL